MGYSTAADLKKLLPEAELLQLADDTGQASGLDDPVVAAVLAEAIDQADREIDAYVAAAQTVPLDPVPPLIANLSVKIAVHVLFLRRSHMDEPEQWADEYKRCLKLLEKIAEGKLLLGAPEQGECADPDTTGGIAVTTPDKMFGPDTWEKF